MKARLPLLVMLAGSVAFLESLFLTWITVRSPAAASTDPTDPFNLIGGRGFSSNGWGAYGQAAAIAAAALGLLAIVSLIRPELERTLPFGGCAIALAALALVNAAGGRAIGAGYAGLTVHLGTGADVGGAAALIALLGAALVNRDELSELRTATVAAATLLTVGLVAAYVLPGLYLHDLPFLEVGYYGTAVMLLLASFGLTFWFRAVPPLRRLATAALVLVLVVGGFSVLGTHTHWPWEAWLAIGCAVGLFALAAGSSHGGALAALGRADAIALVGATVLLGSLFFNWQSESCGLGRVCYVTNQWGGGLTGGLVAILVLILLGFRSLSPELAVAVAIYVLGTGFSYTADGSLRYGAFVGFAGAALLLLASGLQPRQLAVRVGGRLVPVAATVAFLAIPVAALTGRLSANIEFNGAWRLPLLEAAAIVLGLRLIGRWLSDSAGGDELLFLPIALVALTGLELGEAQHILFIPWEGWLALALSVLLVALGWLGRRGGLDNFRIPAEIWRIDRISTGED